MTREELKQILNNAPLKEVNTGITGVVQQSGLFVAYNETESWTFHVTVAGNRTSITVTQVLPTIDVDMDRTIDNIPDYILDMKFDWGDNICDKYGNVLEAMKVYKDEQ